ncbi:hypothetical protein K8R32_01210 [bacterium]|nr:hypothetical protein [bacterium]
MMKLFKSKINEIPASEFPKTKLKVDGELTEVKGEKVREIVADMAEGGISDTLLVKRLKEDHDLQGSNENLADRKKIMKTVKQEDE